MEQKIETMILADLVGELVADAEVRAQAKATGELCGPITGIAGLDEALGLSLAPGVHLLQAPPGAGKTALALQFAATCGFPAVIVSCEMPRIELFRRIIARTTRTFLGRLKTGELAPEVVRELAISAAQKVSHLAIIDSTRAYAHPGDDITPVAQQLRRRFEASHALIVVDSLQAWARAGASGAPEYERISAAISALSGVASGVNCPVIVVSHMNRMANRAQGAGVGGMHGGKGSGDLEYTAETVVELKPGDKRGEFREVGLTIHKNRHGDSGIELRLIFEGRLQEFKEG